MTVSVLEFRLGEDIYCFNTDTVEYVYDLEGFEKLHAFDEAVVGIGKYNHDVMILIDTGLLFCQQPLQIDNGPKSVVVVSDTNGGLYGMVVDEILKIEDVEKADISLNLNTEEMVINHYKEQERLVNEIAPIPLLKSRHIPGFLRHKEALKQTRLRTTDSEYLNVLRFRIGANCFALPSKTVREVVEKESDLFIPPDFGQTLHGAVAVRDEVVELLAIGTTPQKGGQIIVLENDDVAFGLETDEIEDIDRFEKSKLIPVAEESFVSHFYNDGREVVGVIDPKRIVPNVPSQPIQNRLSDQKDRQTHERKGYMIFSIGTKRFAVALDNVRQVLETTRLSKTGSSAIFDDIEHIVFLATWNHRAVQILRLDGWIDTSCRPEEETLTIFLEKEKSAVGFLVDEIEDILFIQPPFISRSESTDTLLSGAILDKKQVIPAINENFLIQLGEA